MFISKIFRKEGKSLDKLSYIFCNDQYLLKINQKYLKHDFYTDIITFDLSESQKSKTGEIYISIDRVKDNASLLHEPFQTELHRVIFHGALHLCRYDDKTRKQQSRMRILENHYLKSYDKVSRATVSL
ncbi:MAG TPA: rRNA maturation RNase YbeY [Chitinophagaceae bacterium]